MLRACGLSLRCRVAWLSAPPLHPWDIFLNLLERGLGEFVVGLGYRHGAPTEIGRDLSWALSIDMALLRSLGIRCEGRRFR